MIQDMVEVLSTMKDTSLDLSSLGYTMGGGNYLP